MNFYTLIPQADAEEQGILFVDHSYKRRSGHLGHALVEYAPGCILAFYSNNSGARSYGHNGYGWVEYRRSTDGGATWSENIILEYSKQAFLDGLYTICCEKAVVNEKGEIILFCLRCSTITMTWGPFLGVDVIISSDGGESWSAPTPLCEDSGRLYDVKVINGEIYCLYETGVFTKEYDNPQYQLYKSCDGKTFALESVLPFELNITGTNKDFGFALSDYFYGCMTVLPDGGLAAYIYQQCDEFNLLYCVSYDFGKTWSEVQQSYCAKRIRNPQIGKLGELYFLHGRSGCVGKQLPSAFVLYTSSDAIHWDEGIYICRAKGTAWGAHGYYSNNVLVTKPDGTKKLLIQSSDAYDEARTNIKHWWIEI